MENCKNSVLNSRSAQRSYFSSKAIASAVAALHLKSILGVGPKIKDSIEDPFR
jgi:predicted flap endonuclease-1-like 5' DNA nuclease